MSANATITSMVARCLLEPGFLKTLADDPDLALDGVTDSDVRSELAHLDVERVRRFAGLITKVQHNDLWNHLPYTRALLKYYGIEHEVFAAYRDSYLELTRPGRPPRSAKVRSFAMFLYGQLKAPGAPVRPGLRDILTHEYLHWEVAELLQQDPPARRHPFVPIGHGDGNLMSSVPVAHTILRIGSFEYDPLDIAACLRAGGQGLPELAPRRCYLGYWGEHAAGLVHVVRLDVVSAVVLAAVDGCCQGAEVVARAARSIPLDLGAEAGEPERALRTAVQRGMLTLHRAEHGGEV